MRRLTQRNDTGATTIFVVLMMPVLVFFGALVFDGGRGLVARRQTQNAADAGALAKATDCAKGISSTDFAPYETNGASLANAPTCGSGETTVAMERNISFAFAPGGGDRDVTRSATAKWGTIGGATTLPVTIASCELDPASLDAIMDITVYIDDPKQTSGCSSVPGGFGLLEGDYDNCAVPISAGDTATGQPGGALQKLVECITNPTAPALPHDVLIPMYDAEVCNADPDCKGHGPYKILGFAMFRVKGYSFNGSDYAGTLGNKCPTRLAEKPSDTPKYCINGDFIKFVTSQGTAGPSTDFGTYQVYLSS